MRWLGLGGLVVAGACAQRLDPSDAVERDDDAVDREPPVDVELETPEVTTVRRTQTVRTNSDGTAVATIEVADGETAMMVTAAGAGLLSVERLVAPGGRRVLAWEDWIDARRSLTEAIVPEYGDVALNWPVRSNDGELTPGTWEVTVAVTDDQGYYLSGVPVEVVTQAKVDPDFTLGSITADVVYAASEEGNTELIDAFREAVSAWRRIWRDRGIEVRPVFRSETIGTILPQPDAPVYTRITTSAPAGSITVVVGESLQLSASEGGGILGIAGGIPGPLEPSPRGITIVGWLDHAGPDGVFDAEETQILGETLAHELGHYVGLYHPIEIDGGFADAIDDTIECPNALSCEAALGANVMFPYPVCGERGCVVQGELTSGQGAVMHRFTGSL